MLSFYFLIPFFVLVLVFYVGKVKLHPKEESNTSLNIEVVSVFSCKTFLKGRLKSVSLSVPKMLKMLSIIT